MVTFFIHDDGEDFQLTPRNHGVLKRDMVPGLIAANQHRFVWENRKETWQSWR